jgi:carotenoid cleavage dioxygenase-like enzyme
VALDPDTLDTLDDRYTFGGKLTAPTFTAHPKIDPRDRRDDRLQIHGAWVPEASRR